MLIAESYSLHYSHSSPLMSTKNRNGLIIANQKIFAQMNYVKNMLRQAQHEIDVCRPESFDKLRTGFVEWY
tara:strand:+ start:224 stop:436 length:213 start_codon:yes stop_codon:yes gene_type:complete